MVTPQSASNNLTTKRKRQKENVKHRELKHTYYLRSLRLKTTLAGFPLGS